MPTRSLFLALLALFGASTASAQLSMDLTANIEAGCRINSSQPAPIAWNLASVAALNSATLNQSTTVNIEVRCPLGTAGVRIEVDGGGNWDDTLRYRFLRHTLDPTRRIPYAVNFGTNGASGNWFVPASLGTVSGYYGRNGLPSVALSFSVANNVSQALTIGVYGSTWVGAALNPTEVTPAAIGGEYTDTLTFNVFF
jgi:hypothetical protein